MFNTNLTAGLLRAQGTSVPDDIPDCAELWGSGYAVRDVPETQPDGRITWKFHVEPPCVYKWIEVTFVVDKDDDPIEMIRTPKERPI